MSATTASTKLPDFGVNCPRPDSLETGDLLFPRKPANLSQFTEMRSNPNVNIQIAPGDKNKTVAEVLGPTRTAILLAGGASALVPNMWAENYSRLQLESNSCGSDSSDLANKITKIVAAAFPKLIRDWLTMTMWQFALHPIKQFLEKAMCAPDVSGNFFVGHVAMVIREADGHSVTSSQGGIPYVIEANSTDFSHYRVSIHPYHAAGDTAYPQSSGGWVNNQCALGKKVWHGRPKCFETTLPGIATSEARQAITNTAKALIGRPYGILDNPEFANPDRLYCSEFVHTAYAGAGRSDLILDEHRTWKWMQSFLNKSSSDIGKIVTSIIDDPGLKIDPETAFFLLTPPMLWHSANMKPLWPDPTTDPYA